MSEDKYSKAISDVTRRYYPYTDKCPLDGNICRGESCEQKFYEKTKCFYHELNKIIFEVFDVPDSYISFGDYEENTIEWYLSIHATYGNYKNKEMDTGIEFRVSSERIYNIDMSVLRDIGVVDNFNLDDSMIKFYKSSFRNLNKIKKYLIFFRDNNKKISKMLIERYKCFRCGKSTVYSHIFENKLICDSCQNDIVIDWVKESDEIVME